MSYSYLNFRDNLMTSEVICPNCGRTIKFNLRNYFVGYVICVCRGGAKSYQDAGVIRLTQDNMPDYVKEYLANN